MNKKNLLSLLIICAIVTLNAREEVITNTTVTQDTTVTIIEPPEPEAPDEPEDSGDSSDEDTNDPITPVIPIITPPVITKTVINTKYIKSTFNTNITKDENANNKKMVYKISFVNPLPANIRLVYYINKKTSSFILGKDIDKSVRENFINIPKGATNAQIEINILDDRLYEPDEKFEIALRLPKKYITYSDGTKEYSDYSYKYSYGTIVDNDLDMLVNVSVPDTVSFNEQDANTKTMDFTLNFSKPLKEDATLKYEIVPNDITLSKDIANSSKVNYISLHKGDTSKKISIKVLDDNLYEQTEYFQIKYYPPNSNFKFSKTYSTGEIVDDEISVTISDYVIFSEDEADKSKMKLNVAFSKEVPNNLVLDYTITPGENLELGKDIKNTSTTGSIVVPKGAKNATIEIEVLDDDLVEDAEYFTLTLKQPAGNYGFINNKSIGVILDDDIKIDVPSEGGDYVIYETGTTDAKLKTKIVNSSTKFDVYASEGFEIFLGETQQDKKTCDDPVCSIVTLPTGQKVQQCVTTCYITTTTVLKYSDKMDIDEIVLRTFKEYDPNKKQCFAEYPKQVVKKDINLNSGAKYTFSIPTNKAFRCGWIEVKGHSEADANGTVTDFEGISDTFAMRPNSFKVDLERKSLTNPLIAGQNVEMKVMAVDASDNVVNSYSGNRFIEKVIDKYYGDSISHGLNINGMLFISGMIKKTVKYDEAGELKITVEETSPAYAEIDKNDNPTTYKIEPAKYDVKVIPDHFDITYMLKDFDESDKLTFMANNPSVMGASLKYSVLAKNKLGTVTKRYSGGKYADNVDINITYSFYTKPSRSLTFNYVDSKGKNSKTVISTNTASVSTVLNDSDFINGMASDTVYENFARDNKLSQNPIELSADTIEAKEKMGVGGVKIFGAKNDATQKAYFYYARAHAPSPQTTDGKTLNAKIYYEVYCKNCDKTIFVNANNNSSVDSLYWYILPDSVLSNLGTSVCDYKNPRVLDSSTISSISHKNSKDLKVITSSVPSKNKIFYTPLNSYLEYNKFGTFLPEHFFEVSFTSGGSNWAGEGTLGTTVDTNVSNSINQPLQW